MPKGTRDAFLTAKFREKVSLKIFVTWVNPTLILVNLLL